MSTNKKNIRPFLIFLAVVLAAILVGYGTTKLQQHKHTDKTTEQLSSDLSEKEKQQQIKLLKKVDYLISRPSQGSLVQKQKITLQYQPDDKALAHIPLKNSEKIHLYQDIILYDKVKTTMPLGGRIKSITPNGNQLDIGISLPEGTKTEYLSNESDILVLDAGSTLRFPLTALQQDKNDNYYVWAAEKLEGDTLFKAKQVWVEAPLIGEHNFVAGIDITVNSLLILEPNKKVKHNATYKMAEVEYKFPRHNPIKQAYYDYHIQRRQKETQEGRQNLIDCRANAREKAKESKNKKYGTAGGQSRSCGASTSTNGKTDPMDIFNAILSRQPNKPASGSCGAPSCGAP